MATASAARRARAYAQGIHAQLVHLLGLMCVPRVYSQQDGMPCGTMVSQFVLQALYVGKPSDHGTTSLAVLTSDAKNSWLNMIKQGATATMEMWTPDEKPNLTWSHVWSASPGFIIPWFLFGIQPVEPGWAKMTIKPAPGALTHGEFRLPTVKGVVVAHFTKDPHEQAALRLKVTLPLGTQARVSIPLLDDARSSFAMTMNGAAVADCIAEEHHLTAPAVGPGEHVFELVAR